MPAQQIPSYSHPIVDPRTGRITTPWYQFLMRLTNAANSGGGGGNAPADAQYVVGAADLDLPNARVPTDSLSVDFDLATAGQLKAYALVALLGALDGGSASALQVRVDNVTIGINADNKLEVIGGADCQPLTNGDAASPELIFADGDVVMVCA